MNEGYYYKEKIGKIFEGIVPSIFENGGHCWRGHKCKCLNKPQIIRTPDNAEDDKGNGVGMSDHDFMIRLECKGCPYIKSTEDLITEQYHEAKNNSVTFDEKGITRNGLDLDVTKQGKKPVLRTQNLYIEFIQTLSSYKKDERDTFFDVVSGKKVEYRKGDGWWTKRVNAGLEHPHADWYHFCMPLGTPEQIGTQRHNRKAPPYASASEDTVRKFLEDKSIEDNAVLITKYPTDLCISVSGEDLEGLVDVVIGYGGIVMEGGYLTGALIPVSLLVPSTDRRPMNINEVKKQIRKAKREEEDEPLFGGWIDTLYSEDEEEDETEVSKEEILDFVEDKIFSKTVQDLNIKETPIFEYVKKGAQKDINGKYIRGAGALGADVVRYYAAELIPEWEDGSYRPRVSKRAFERNKEIYVGSIAARHGEVMMPDTMFMSMLQMGKRYPDDVKRLEE